MEEITVLIPVRFCSASLDDGKVGSVGRYGVRWDLRPVDLTTDNYSVDYNMAFETGSLRHNLLLFGVDMGKRSKQALDFLINVQPDLETMEAIMDPLEVVWLTIHKVKSPTASFWTPEWVEENETGRRDRVQHHGCRKSRIGGH